MSTPLSITAAYAFVPIPRDDLARLCDEITVFGESQGMIGHTLIAEEGVNGTVAGTPAAIAAWKEFLQEKFGPIVFKDSAAACGVFRRWTVKIKPEIVGLKKPEIFPQGRHRHLTPAEWQAVLEREDVVLVDTRNDYEYAIGRFRGALPPPINAFHDFPKYVAESGIPKDKKVLMYCTGGIRCEKALLEMESQGYEHVYQLEGGILAYLEQFPEKAFEGECFVFDHRVAVDQALQPSRVYGLCPHCGYAGDQVIACGECGKTKKICATCAKDESKRTCSKRCANEVKKAKVC